MITAVHDDVTGCVVTENDALVCPAVTVTAPGTVATAGALFVRPMVTPPAGAGSEMKTVPIAELPPVTPWGFTPIPVSVGALVVPVMVKLRVADHALTVAPLTACTRQKYVPFAMSLMVAWVTVPAVLPTAAVAAKLDVVLTFQLYAETGPEGAAHEIENGVTTDAPLSGLTRVGAPGGVGGGKGSLIVMLNGPLFDWPPESATRKVKLYVPAVVGVPWIRPGDACRLRPGGSVPPVRVQLYGDVPPSANTPTA